MTYLSLLVGVMKRSTKAHAIHYLHKFGEDVSRRMFFEGLTRYTVGYMQYNYEDRLSVTSSLRLCSSSSQILNLS